MTTRSVAELIEAYRLSPTPTVYDVFAEAYSNLQGAYSEAGESASSPAESDLWLDRARALHRFRDRVAPDDRRAAIEAIVLMGREREQVLAHIDAQAASPAA